MAPMPVVFDVALQPTASRAAMHKNYHKVNRQELKLASTPKPAINFARSVVEELNGRAEFTGRFYNGRYDSGHRQWNHKLAQHVPSALKPGLSLDALIAISK